MTRSCIEISIRIQEDKRRNAQFNDDYAVNAENPLRHGSQKSVIAITLIVVMMRPSYTPQR